jgi:hypothetical protein
MPSAAWLRFSPRSPARLPAARLELEITDLEQSGLHRNAGLSLAEEGWQSGKYGLNAQEGPTFVESVRSRNPVEAA